MGLSRWQRARLIYGWGYRAADLDAFGFTDGRPASDAGRFLGGDWCSRHVHTLNDDRAVLLTENKWVFYRFAESLKLPVPTTLGLLDPIYGVSWDGLRPLRTVDDALAEVTRRRPAGLVVKPAGGGQGQQVTILDRIDHETGTATMRTGEVTTMARVLQDVDPTGMRGVAGTLLQEPVANHPEIARIAPTTTNTVRLLTLLGNSGEVHVQMAAMRLGRTGGMVDNVSAGGIGLGVDAHTGEMESGVTHIPGKLITVHPDTGVPFVGRTVPFWDETVDLCRRAARLFPGVRSVGWDVVVSPDGPVLLEANAYWSLRGQQRHSDGWLADPAIREQFQDAGVPLPNGRLTREAVTRVRERLVTRLRR